MDNSWLDKYLGLPTIQIGGTAITAQKRRAVLNLIAGVGIAISGVEDVAQERYDVTITSAGGGSAHVIQDSSVSRTARSKLNFDGLLQAVDDAANDQTDIAITPGVSHTVMVTDAGLNPTWVELTNVHIAAAAAIAGTKIAPDFGAQNIKTTGALQLGASVAGLGDIQTDSTFEVWGLDGGAVDRPILRWNGLDVVLGGINSTATIYGSTITIGSGATSVGVMGWTIGGTATDPTLSAGKQAIAYASGTSTVTFGESTANIVINGLDGLKIQTGANTRLDVSGTAVHVVGTDLRLDNARDIRFGTDPAGGWIRAMVLASDDTLMIGNSTAGQAPGIVVYDVLTGGTHQTRVANATQFTVGTGYVALGATVATTGSQRVGTSYSVVGLKADGTADRSLLGWSSDILTIGANASPLNTQIHGTTTVNMYVGGASRLQVETTVIAVQIADVRFSASVIAPKFYQADDATNGITADTMLVRAQNATGTTSIGGALDLSSGAGTASDGATRLQVGGETMLEGCEVAAGRRVVALAFGANLTTTQMPANTGDRVVFGASCATVPTAAPVGGGILYWDGDGNLHAVNEAGVDTQLTP